MPSTQFETLQRPCPKTGGFHHVGAAEAAFRRAQWTPTPLSQSAARRRPEQRPGEQPARSNRRDSDSTQRDPEQADRRHAGVGTIYGTHIAGAPKSEDEMTDHLCNELDRMLASLAPIVNREGAGPAQPHERHRRAYGTCSSTPRRPNCPRRTTAGPSFTHPGQRRAGTASSLPLRQLELVDRYMRDVGAAHGDRRRRLARPGQLLQTAPTVVVRLALCSDRADHRGGTRPAGQRPRPAGVDRRMLFTWTSPIAGPTAASLRLCNPIPERVGETSHAEEPGLPFNRILRYGSTKGAASTLAPILRSDAEGRILARVLVDPEASYSFTDLVGWSKASMPTGAAGDRPSRGGRHRDDDEGRACSRPVRGAPPTRSTTRSS